MAKNKQCRMGMTDYEAYKVLYGWELAKAVPHYEHDVECEDEYEEVAA